MSGTRMPHPSDDPGTRPHHVVTCHLLAPVDAWLAMKALRQRANILMRAGEQYDATIHEELADRLREKLELDLGWPLEVRGDATVTIRLDGEGRTTFRLACQNAALDAGHRGGDGSHAGPALFGIAEDIGAVDEHLRAVWSDN